MINIFKFEEENEEKCRLKCLDELDLYNNEILTKEYEENNKYIMEVIKKSDVKEFIKNYLNEVIKSIGIEVRLEINEDENVFNVKMFSDNNSILIGKDGKNLSAIQTLLRQTLNNNANMNIKLNLDASNYKLKKEKYFEKNIKNIINDVLKNKDEIKLDPMNSYNRRIVHSIASDYYNIETESFGEEPNRYVIIRYKEN